MRRGIAEFYRISDGCASRYQLSVVYDYERELLKIGLNNGQLTTDKGPGKKDGR